MKLLRGEANIDFVGKIGVLGVLSILAVLGSIAAVSVLGINFGIDFAGGYEIQVKFPERVEEARVKELVEPLGLGDARVQRFGPVEDNEYLVLVRQHGTITDQTKRDMKADFEALAGGPDELSTWSVAQSGETMMVGFTQPVDEEKIRGLVAKHKLQIKSMTRGEREDQPEYSILLVSLADDIEGALRSGLGIEEKAKIVKRMEFVGPQVGEQLQSQGIFAILWALFFILIYIAVRFDLLFSPGAVVALIHDVFITVGIFAIFQLEFNLPIVAAILAIIGYSLNDTIVVYDRIRENMIRLRGRELRAMVNTSLNQTLSRTLLTSVTTLLVVLALLFVGGGIIRDFSIALCIGILVGTYSSMFVASPVYILLRERYKGTISGGGTGTGSGGGTAVAA